MAQLKIFSANFDYTKKKIETHCLQGLHLFFRFHLFSQSYHLYLRHYGFFFFFCHLNTFYWFLPQALFTSHYFWLNYSIPTFSHILFHSKVILSPNITSLASVYLIHC